MKPTHAAILLWSVGVPLYSVLTSGGAGSGDGLVIDGIAFPPSLQMGGAAQQVTGGGTRTKYGVAKVYAVALYLDSGGAASSLRPLKGAAKAKKQPFYDAVIKGGFAKTLLLQFHRSVAGPTVAEALADSLTKRLSPAAVARFRDALVGVVGDDVPKGTKLYFMCKGSSLLIGEGKPSAAAKLNEKGACEALLDVYLGKAPISPAAKDGVAAGFVKRMYAD